MTESRPGNAGGAESNDVLEQASQEGARNQEKEPAQPEAGEAGDVPDPDEDDLDDLDDMLDEFSAARIDETKPEVPSGSAPQPNAQGNLEEGVEMPGMEELLSDDDFAKQLQAGMADLLGDMENSPEMKAQFESIFKEMDAAGSTAPADSAGLGSAAEQAGASGASRAAGATPSADDSFQETIRRTMERMQTSGDQATAAATSEGSDDFMAELLKQMQAGGLEGEGSEEEFSKMLLGMMEQLTNKEILYEPMKELNDKFPDWLERNKDKISQDDLKRYEEQQLLVKEIVGKFTESTYSDDNAADREYIVDRMQKMQAAGSPPADLVGEMPSAQEAFNAPDESCNPQ